MIVLDRSVLVGIVKGEAWCSINPTRRSSRWLERFVDSRFGVVVPFGREMADVAGRAFDKFAASSGHPARLSSGDCMAYAVATAMRAPLLFKGSVFGSTDVMVYPASIQT